MIQGTSAIDRPLRQRYGGWQRTLLALGLLAIPLAAAGALWPRLNQWWAADRSVDLSRIRLAAVTRGDLERDVSVQGRIVAAFHPTSFSPASGTVNLLVRAGEVVDEGHVLARIDSPELASRVAQERSSLRSLESDLERQRILAKQTMLSSRQSVDLAELELEAATRALGRAEQSRRDGILNEVELERAQDDLRRAELALIHGRESAELERETLDFDIRNRQHQLERQRLVVGELERQVDDLTVRAPVAGLVSRIDVEDHDAVIPAQPLVSVVDLSAFEIEIQIPESYADEVGPGTPAVVFYDGAEWAGRLRNVSPEVAGNQVLGVVSFVDQAPEGLRQNQRLSTRLILESRLDVLKVQRGPFLDVGGGREAYVVRGDLAELSPIEIGAVSVSEIEIASGLSEGDRIIVSDTARFEKARRVFLRQ